MIIFKYFTLHYDGSLKKVQTCFNIIYSTSPQTELRLNVLVSTGSPTKRYDSLPLISLQTAQQKFCKYVRCPIEQVTLSDLTTVMSGEEWNNEKFSARSLSFLPLPSVQISSSSARSSDTSKLLPATVAMIVDLLSPRGSQKAMIICRRHRHTFDEEVLSLECPASVAATCVFHRAGEYRKDVKRKFMEASPGTETARGTEVRLIHSGNRSSNIQFHVQKSQKTAAYSSSP